MRDALLDAIAAPEPAGLAFEWLEKVRRFASFAGRRLSSVATSRFNDQADEQLSWMALFLLRAADRHPGKGVAPVDQACLSAALYCIDAASSPASEAVDAAAAAEARLRDWLAGGGVQEAPDAIGEIYQGETAHWRDEAAQCGGLVLLSPNPLSLYSVAVLEICIRLDLPVRAILLRSFSARRFLQEWKRDGWRLIRKIWRKLILRSDENRTEEGLSIKDLLRSLSPASHDIRRTAKAKNIPLIEVADFSSRASLLKAFNASLGLFTGGGMVDADTLSAFSTGVINVHLGELPHYKGMDVVEAPFLEGRRTVAIAAHLMVPALDAGPAILRVRADATAYASLGALRNSVGCIQPFAMIEAALGLSTGRLRALPQPVAGRQFFIMHPRLRRLIDEMMPPRHSSLPRAGTPLEAQVETAVHGLS